MPPSPRREVLSCYTLMAYKTRAQIEKASHVLLELLGSDKDYVPALVCLSQAYLMLKQAPKARNHLKRVAKIAFAAEMVDDFERGLQCGAAGSPMATHNLAKVAQCAWPPKRWHL